MKPLGIRFATVSPSDVHQGLVGMFEAMGLKQKDLGDLGGVEGAVFPAGEHSCIEAWGELDGLPKGIMLQVIVDDADAYAEHARANGLDPKGPVDAHGERIYYLIAPGGLSVSFQSSL